VKKTYIETSAVIGIFLSPRARAHSTSICACLAVVAEMQQATIYDVVDRLKINKGSARIALATLAKEGFLDVEKGSKGCYGRAKNIYRIKA